jgi:hypothetical protein
MLFKCKTLQDLLILAGADLEFVAGNADDTSFFSNSGCFVVIFNIVVGAGRNGAGGVANFFLTSGFGGGSGDNAGFIRFLGFIGGKFINDIPVGSSRGTRFSLSFNDGDAKYIPCGGKCVVWFSLGIGGEFINDIPVGGSRGTRFLLGNDDADEKCIPGGGSSGALFLLGFGAGGFDSRDVFDAGNDGESNVFSISDTGSADDIADVGSGGALFASGSNMLDLVSLIGSKTPGFASLSMLASTSNGFQRHDLGLRL